MPTPPRLPKLPSLSSALCLQDSGWLDVGAGHRIAWSRHGTPDGMPAVVLHGGPGSGSSARNLEFFDLARWQVVLFDQRGCGRSTPLGDIAHNTTADLVDDIEALRQHLGIARWLVVGGSWGATLALTYALRHGQHCLGLLLRGTFLGQQADIDWFVDGARAVQRERGVSLYRQVGAPGRSCANLGRAAPRDTCFDWHSFCVQALYLASPPILSSLLGMGPLYQC